MNKRTRLTPRRGRLRQDVKQIKIPDYAHRMLYEYAHAHNMTFGDAAAKLISDSILDLMDVPPESTTAVPFSGKRVQVKVPKETHSALYLLAAERGMAIGDTAALLIGVSLMKLYKLDEDAATKEQRIKREKRLRRLDPTMKGTTPMKRSVLEARVSLAVNNQFDELLAEMRRALRQP